MPFASITSICHNILLLQTVLPLFVVWSGDTTGKYFQHTTGLHFLTKQEFVEVLGIQGEV
jgi:hypothetical protein